MAKYNTISRCIVETLVVLRNKRSKWDSQWLLSCKHRQIVWDWLQWLKTSKLGNKWQNMLCLFWKYLNPIARISWIYLIKTPTFKCYLKYWGTLFAIFGKKSFPRAPSYEILGREMVRIRTEFGEMTRLNCMWRGLLN